MIGRALLWLSGVDQNVLSHCERERGKFVAMGGTVVTTSVLAAIAATFTVHEYLHASLFVAVLVGVGWGLAIMNLDRWLLITIRRQETTAKTILVAMPRVILAILIGLVIAEPLVLRVFDSEVTAQAEEDQRSEYRDGLAEVRDRYAAIPRLRKEERQIQADLIAVSDGSDLLESPEYVNAQEAVRRLEKRAAQATGSAGEAIAAELEAERQRLAAIRGQVLSREAVARKQTRRFEQRRLRTIQAELRRQRERREGGVQELDSAYGSIGLLDRVEALGSLTGRRPTMMWIRVVLTLLILMVDSLPALAKVLMSVGKESLYEETQNRMERYDAAALEQQVKAYEKASEVDASLIIDEATARRAMVKEVQDDLIKQAVEAMREAGERFVAGWGKVVVESADDLVEAELKRSGLDPQGTKPPRSAGESSTNGHGQGVP